MPQIAAWFGRDTTRLAVVPDPRPLNRPHLVVCPVTNVATRMLIPINIAVSGSSSRPLPPQFAQFGTDELVLIELQGSFQTEGDRAGQLAAHLHVGETVSVLYNC